MDKANMTYKFRETEEEKTQETALYDFGYVATALGALVWILDILFLMFIIGVMIEAPKGEWSPGNVYGQHALIKTTFWIGLLLLTLGGIALIIDVIKTKRWNHWQWFLKLRTQS